MNRLGAIETNHTLYAQYIEQQNSAIRDLIKRLNEDMGRLEAVVSNFTKVYHTSNQLTDFVDQISTLHIPKNHPAMGERKDADDHRL
jgi:hypothetical protein